MSEFSRPPLDRPVSPGECAILHAAFERAPKGPGASHLVANIESLHVVSRCGCGCDSVQFAHHDPAHPPRIVADGLGTTPAGGQVGILVWATEDKITGLEIYDMGAGDLDTKLPLPDSVHGWEPKKT